MRIKNSENRVGKNPWENHKHPRGMKGKHSWNAGKSLPAETCEKISKTRAGKPTWWSTLSHEELSISARERILARYAAGWMPRAGRCKKIEYDSKFAGNVLLDGSWELLVAEKFDEYEIVWKRNTQRFPYKRPDGRQSTYTPDFYVASIDSFVEVKGYETELDRSKWSQFPHRLLIWKKNEIENIGEVIERIIMPTCYVGKS